MGARPTTRGQEIVDRIADAIERGLLKPGEKLASVRRAAEDHGVSKNTMAEAYDRLVASGHLEPRRGAGYFAAATARPARARVPPHLAEAIDTVSLLREQLEAQHKVRPGDGRPPPGWMEGSELSAQFAGGKWRPGGSLEHGYGSSWGFLPLRERIALSLVERGVSCAPDQVLTTMGANHALDLVIRHIAEPGDTVVVDDPGYYPLFGKLQLARLRAVGVRRLAEGPDPDELVARLAQHRPKAFFTQSLAHNPTGGTLAPAIAHRVLAAAERHGVTIVECDPFADILPAASTRLAALDGLRRVISIGTFSKTLSASLRVGYVAAAPAVVAALNDLKMLTVVSTSTYAERFVAHLIQGGHYLRHLRRLRQRVEAATALAVRQLGEAGWPVAPPAGGGLYLWVPFPAGLDEAEICHRASAEGIFLAPGSIFRPERGAEGQAAMMRVNVAYASDPHFLAFLAQAASRR
ncbi:aminotransferase-like domain-containing protein [Falsiroseomonas ponticola]|uniref:aminotransferase-like domain-containing protein n=1 Tax=Falsiroseomonas ponticola TaxID=2786951 RepID=UPI001932D9FE|nr:PLP-dependent aminotransferase family protein [Roseomonas ponticola]